MAAFHFIRPFWLLSVFPLVLLAWYLLRQAPSMTAWSKVCDNHLLPYLIQNKGVGSRTFSWLFILVSAVFMIISLAGPTWSRLPVPTYQQVQPRVVLLDMSEGMAVTDLTPDRLSRAKFKLHDLFMHQDAGQFGLVVYTGEPFVVSPLTEDGQTIDALLSSLTPDIMPVEGQQLATALEQGAQLIKQAGFQQGQLLVLTASAPSPESISTAKGLARAGIETSVIPVLSTDIALSPSFQQLVSAGQGELIRFTDTAADIDKWLAATHQHQHYTANLQDEIPLWRDEGRWFLIPALLLLLPVFRRGWLQGLTT